ncbi:c-type cytochrome [Thiomicrospira sp. ALE5]|uniref:c-type cytochrome n=1 Tax=Thiomicrospira sp. ALE5 TaxID=748650 RepID=UPI0008ED9966|nr:c-type cytochrome [Thiomicrospira sp. ALE5]SFR51606.1 Cytochrome C oxidase, cbb3-type, subunit III [Thiomicrospira sp. ALE5]
MRLNKLTATFFAATLAGSSLMLVGCGSDNYSDAEKKVDTREVAKPAEPSMPSLSSRVESDIPATFTGSTDSQAMPETTTSPGQPPMMAEEVPETLTEATETVTQVAAAPAANGQQLYSTCMGCHGATGGGGVGPKLQGQDRDDFISKMNAYRAGEQVGPMTAMMAPMAANLTDAEIEALADYIVTF